MEVSSPPNLVRPFKSRHQRLTPEHLQSIAGGINRMVAGVRTPQSAFSGIQVDNSLGIQWATITALNMDGTYACDDPGGSSIVVNAAPLLANTLASRTAFGNTISYAYSDAQTRTATYTGHSETEVVVPMLEVGEVILVAGVDGKWQDLNVSAHAWARQ